MTPTRRSLLTAPLAGTLAASLSDGAEAFASAGSLSAADLLERYVAFGGKASGGPGDIACGDWMTEWLAARGFSVERLAFDAPFFEVEDAWFQVGETRVNVIPQAMVVQTGPRGVEGPVLVREPEDAGARRTAPSSSFGCPMDAGAPRSRPRCADRSRRP